MSMHIDYYRVLECSSMLKYDHQEVRRGAEKLSGKREMQFSSITVNWRGGWSCESAKTVTIGAVTHRFGGNYGKGSNVDLQNGQCVASVWGIPNNSAPAMTKAVAVWKCLM